jgi:hypothetical protein
MMRISALKKQKIKENGENCVMSFIICATLP